MTGCEARQLQLRLNVYKCGRPAGTEAACSLVILNLNHNSLSLTDFHPSPLATFTMKVIAVASTLLFLATSVSADWCTSYGISTRFSCVSTLPHLVSLQVGGILTWSKQGAGRFQFCVSTSIDLWGLRNHHANGSCYHSVITAPAGT